MRRAASGGPAKVPASRTTTKTVPAPVRPAKAGARSIVPRMPSAGAGATVPAAGGEAMPACGSRSSAEGTGAALARISSPSRRRGASCAGKRRIASSITFSASRGLPVWA